MEEHRVLGPVTLTVNGQDLDLGPPRQRCVLAALYLGHGRPLSVSRLVERVWDQQPPGRADELLHTYLSRLRRVLRRYGMEPIQRTGRGYQLTVDRESIDYWRFERLVEEGRRAAQRGCPEGVDLLRRAVSLWRGEALGGVSGGWVDRTRGQLERRRLAVWAECFELELRAGRHAQVVDEIAELVTAHPDSEPLTAHLMTALAATGRRSEALTAYRSLRTAMTELHGLEPGQELRALQSAILRNDRCQHPGLPTPGSLATAPNESGTPRPALLPLDAVGFVGRGECLNRLDLIAAGFADEPTAVVVSAVSGAAGVGKTALAVHWAHGARASFPDGQLYANLRGFDLQSPPATPGEVIRDFLDALGVPTTRVPQTLNGQVALYRSLLVGKRMLVLLDNARDAAQVRPLLPGAAGCLVLITSRDALPSLVLSESARPLTVGLMSGAEARRLLEGRVGAERIGASPHAVDDIIGFCGGLPLALAIVASRAAARPDQPLTVIAEELHAARSRLDALDDAYLQISLRSVFGCTYRTLSGDAARTFRVLGLHPGPVIGLSALASLAARPGSELRAPLAELTRGHLVIERSPGRYMLHDLLRAYAAELAAEVDTEADRREGVRRLFDHYLHTAEAAMSRFDPHRQCADLDPPMPGVTVDDFADPADAHAWLAAEHQVLVAAVHHAAAAAVHPYAWRLAAVVGRYLDNRGDWQAWIAVEQAALSAAQAAGDRPAQAEAHRTLGRAHSQTGEYRTARTHHDAALRYYEDLGDRSGAAAASFSLTCSLHMEGEFRHSLTHAKRALDLYRAVGHRIGEARSRNLVGWTHAMLGDYQQARSNCEAALAMVRELDDRYGQAATLDSIGYIHHHSGDHARAVSTYRNALALYRAAGDRFNEADVLDHLGDAYTATGHTDRATETWRRALRILDELDHPAAERLRAKLGASQETSSKAPSAEG